VPRVLRHHETYAFFSGGEDGLFRTIPLVRDARVPLPLKLIAAAIALLVISPVDLFSDIPVVGALDERGAC